MQKLWLSKQFLNWYVFSGGGEIVDRNLYERSYEIWQHSNNLIENATNDLQLSDGIMNLKRCLNHRLQLIEKLYEFKSIHIEDKPKSKETLELLEKYGLVRPTIMKTLMYIRNGIEHRDENPPDKKRCKEFVDIIWYFLKSTDSIVHIKRTDANFDYYDFDGNETQYGCNIDINYKNNISLKICGWFPKELVSDIYKEDYLEVVVEDIHTKEKWRSSQVLSELALDVSPHEDKLDTDLWLNGEIKLKQIDAFNVVSKIINSY